jgi:hypothetical protein
MPSELTLYIRHGLYIPCLKEMDNTFKKIIKKKKKKRKKEDIFAIEFKVDK